MATTKNRDINRKSRFFHAAPVFDAPLRETSSELRHIPTIFRTRIAGLPEDETFEDMFSRFNDLTAKNIVTLMMMMMMIIMMIRDIG